LNFDGDIKRALATTVSPPKNRIQLCLDVVWRRRLSAELPMAACLVVALSHCSGGALFDALLVFLQCSRRGF